MQKKVVGADHEFGRITDELDAISKNLVIKKNTTLLNGKKILIYSENGSMEKPDF